MSAPFIGRFVTAQLADGTSLQGIVNRVDQGELGLSNVYFVQSNSSLPTFTLSASQITDIQVLPEPPTRSVAQAPTAQPSTAQPSIFQAPIVQPHIVQPHIVQPHIVQPHIVQPPIVQPRIIQHSAPPPNTNHAASQSAPEPAPSAFCAPGRAPSPDRKKNGKSKKHHDQYHVKGKQPDHNNSDNWDSDIKAIQSSEFDFQANLDTFDKQSVFEEIRRNDSIDPELRLHSHNRNTNANSNAKYGNTEMIINDGSRKSETAAARRPSAAAVRVLSETRMSSISPTPRGRRAVLVNGQLVPLITPLQRVELDNLMKDQLPTQIENAGRGIASVILQALGGSSRFSPTNHNASPVVVILGGRLSKTASDRAIAASRFLRNRGVIVSHWKEGVDSSILAVGPVDLIIDAISGIEADPHEDVDPATQQLTDWVNDVNNRRVPIVSLDVPCPWIVRPPRIIVSSGLPSSGIPSVYTDDPSSTTTTSQYIVDINIPKEVLTNRFARFQSLYFGAEFLVKATPAPPA